LREAQASNSRTKKPRRFLREGKTAQAAEKFDENSKILRRILPKSDKN